MSFESIRAIYGFEMARTRRTLMGSIVSPVISTSLYFIVFGAAIGSRIPEVGGVSYGAFIVPGLVMLSLLTQSISNASFGIYFPRFSGTIYELLSAPVSPMEIVIGYVGAAATKSIAIGLIILGTAALFVPLRIDHPMWMLLYLVLTAVTFSLVGFIIGIWADGFEKLQVVPLLIVTPLTFLGGSFYSIDMLADGGAVQSGGLPGERLSVELLRRGRRGPLHEPGRDRAVPRGLAGRGDLDLQDGVPAQGVSGRVRRRAMARRARSDSGRDDDETREVVPVRSGIASQHAEVRHRSMRADVEVGDRLRPGTALLPIPGEGRGGQRCACPGQRTAHGAVDVEQGIQRIDIGPGHQLLDRPPVPGTGLVDAVDPDIGVQERSGAAVVARENGARSH
jgi:ABC-2 type transport system permease protein